MLYTYACMCQSKISFSILTVVEILIPIPFKCSSNLYALYFNSHENASGYYRVSSYYIYKLLGDLILLRIIPIPIFAIIAYWMIGTWSLHWIHHYENDCIAMY